MKYILIFCLTIFCTTANAQFGKEVKEALARAKENARQKANSKVDQKVDQGLDSALSVPEKLLKNKKGKKSKTETDQNDTKSSDTGEQSNNTAEKNTPESTSDNSSSNNNEAGGVNEITFKEVIVKTNIRCETGKKKLETILRNTDGVISVLIDNDNGNLYLSSENPDVRNKAIELIRQNGFEADGKNPTKPIPNPCK